MDENHVICEVAHGSAAYWAAVELKNAILRKPLGLLLSEEELEVDQGARHVACCRGDRLVGCLSLLPQDSDVKMRHVAVAADMQGQGIGKALVVYSEALARKAGFRRMVLSARETAVPFYEKLGYRKVGGRFEKITIPHWAMEKLLD